MKRDQAITILKLMKDRTEKKANGPFKKSDFFSEEAQALNIAINEMEAVQQ